ncbi:MAG: nitroreductase family protein [Nitrososphaeraceae archaeon]
MDAYQCILTKLDIREFNKHNVPDEYKQKILESARSTGTGLNTQHWKFILVEKKENLKKLSEDSTSGSWIYEANFAIIILTNPRYKFHLIDAGRVLQNMQLTAWNYKIGSGLFTGIIEDQLRKDFTIPNEMHISTIIGFGYPTKILTGKKKTRKPLSEFIYYENYGNS